jgi:anti-sigma28 factor (negative regulator of flagellin synthesis)
MSSLTLIAENVETAANGSFGRLEEESQFRRHKRFLRVLRVRKEKVRAIRHRLAEGTYDLDEHLNTIVDSLFAALNGTKVVSASHISI